ncbi:MAG: hypothetical protein M1819_001107 [Sarea resinae]|nr:MAG: hypothetical protein M1819_001107 [Sarea resinae]
MFSAIIALLAPLYLIVLALTFLPRTVIKILRNRQFSALLDWPTFQSIWFANFWSQIGPTIAEQGTPDVTPFISLARGVVLDIGPGSGEWLHLYNAANVTKVYGVEPNIGHHATLREKVKKAGLEGTYEVIGAGAEDLKTLGLGIGKESVDTIVTLQVLCSVPEPATLIRELYDYLKPGGQWIMCEHVRTHQKGFVARYQANPCLNGLKEALNIVWPRFFNGCSLLRNTDEMLKEVGEWDDVRMGLRMDSSKYSAVPGMVGVLTKRSS